MPFFQRLTPTGQILVPSDFSLTERIISELAATGRSNIFIRRVKGLGDVLMAALVANGLRRKLPSRIFKIHLATSPNYKRLISETELVDSVVEDGYKGPFMVNLQGKIDFLPGCSKQHRLDAMAAVVGLKKHEIQTDFRIRMTRRWRAWGRRRLYLFRHKKKIALAPWATAKIRSWPRWSEFVDLLWKKGYVGVLLHDKKIKTAAEYKMINLTGETDVMQLFSVLSECDAAVAVDSGVLHACGFLGLPFVGLFGSIDPDFRVRYYGQKKIIFLKDSCPICPCWDWQKGSCAGETYLKCMTDITPQMALESLERLIGDRR